MKADLKMEELNLVRLEDALLCANCEVIVNQTLGGGKCPACGSLALLNVSPLLGGTLERPCTASFFAPSILESADSKLLQRA